MFREKLQNFDPPLSKIVSVEKVAQKVGCSKMTVYKVIKGNDEISADTSKKVVKAMIDLMEEKNAQQANTIRILKGIVGENLALSA